MNWLQPTMVAMLLLTGLGVALLGSVKIPLAQRLQMDEARVGGLISLFGFVMGPVVLVAGFLTDFVGPQPVLIGGSLLYAVSLVALGSATTYRAALAAVLLFSTGWALQINVGNVLIPPAFTEGLRLRRSEAGLLAVPARLARRLHPCLRVSRRS